LGDCQSASPKRGIVGSVYQQPLVVDLNLDGAMEINAGGQSIHERDHHW